MRKNCIQSSLIRESHFSGSSSLFPQINLRFRKFVTSNKKLYTISCTFPLAFFCGFHLIRPCAAYPWPFPADSAANRRPLPGFRPKKPVICAAQGPQMIGFFPRNAPEATVSLYSSCCFRICRHPLSSFSFQKKRGALPSFPACSQPSPPLPLAWSRSEKPAAPRSRNILQLRDLRCIQRQKAQPFFSRQLVGELFVSGFAQPLGGEPPLITASRMQPPAAVWSLA